MTCKKVRKLLDDHVDGLLPTHKSERIRGHLDGCPECEAEHQALRAVTAPLAEWDDLDPPDGCFDRILDRIAALPPDALETTPPRLRVLRGRTRRITAAVGVAAAAALVAATTLPEPPARDRVTAPRTKMVPTAGLGSAINFNTGLKTGESRLRRVVIDDDLERTDGLRRRSLEPDTPRGPFSVPVNLPAGDLQDPWTGPR